LLFASQLSQIRDCSIQDTIPMTSFKHAVWAVIIGPLTRKDSGLVETTKISDTGTLRYCHYEYGAS
jgi:hypothetical protein